MRNKCGDIKTTGAKNGGFSYIELLAALVVISVGLGSMYAVMYRGLNHMRILSGRNYAVVAASSEIEILKEKALSELADNYTGPFLGAVDLSPLNDGRGTLRVRDYADSDGRLKRVTATVTWTAFGKKREVSISTVVGKP